jgi:adenine phosphoribosyltransferase
MAHLGLVTILVRDYDEAIGFFTGPLGFELVEDTPQDGRRWVVVRPPGAAETGVLLALAAGERQRAAVGAQTGGRVGLFLNTDDFASTHAAMAAAGVHFAEEPRHEPYGTVAVFEDLYGNRWDLLEPAQPDDLEPRLEAAIRTVPDWPEPGIVFRDVTPVLADADLLRLTIGALAGRARRCRPDAVVGIDARGFILGAALANELRTGFVPVRKQGKLPAATLSESYDLEYGSASLEIHRDGVQPGARVVVVDDLVATGGTMLATTRLVGRLGAEVAAALVMVDLPALGGSAALGAAGIPLDALVSY